MVILEATLPLLLGKVRVQYSFPANSGCHHTHSVRENSECRRISIAAFNHDDKEKALNRYDHQYVCRSYKYGTGVASDVLCSQAMMVMILTYSSSKLRF